MDDVQPSQDHASLDQGVLLDLGADPLSFTGWEHLGWPRKHQDDPPFPATPSYNSLRSFNSHGSNASVYSATFEDDYDMQPMHSGSYTGDESPFGYHSSFDPTSDEAYNPNNYGANHELTLLEDHIGQPSPHFEITEAGPAFQYGHRAEQSPGSSPGEYDQGRRSRASSVSSHHALSDHPSPAPSLSQLGGFNDALANFNINGDGQDSHPPSPSPYLNEITISVSPNAPSPPPSTTTPATPLTSNAKPLGRQLIIPATPTISAGFGLDEGAENTPSEMKTAQPIASSSFLFPPQDPSLHLAPDYRVGGNSGDADGGPAIRLIPSTPVSAGGGGAAYNAAPFQQPSNNNGSAMNPGSEASNSNPVSSDSVPRWNLPTWQHDAQAPSRNQGNNGDSNGASHGQAFQSPNNNQQQNNSSWEQPRYQPNPFPPQPSELFALPRQQQQGGFQGLAPAPLGHRARSASYSGVPARGNWQDPSPYPMYDYQNQQMQQQQPMSFQQPQQQHSQHQGGQGTVDPNELLGQQRPPLAQPYDPRSLDSLLTISPDTHHTSFDRSVSPDLRLIGSSRPSSPYGGDSPFSFEGVSLRRFHSTGSAATGHRRGSRSEDVSRGRGPNWDHQAEFIKSITSVDGSLIPPDPRSPPPSSHGSPHHRGRRGSASSSVTSDRGSPYSRPPSLSPGRKNVPLPGIGSVGKVERLNVTTPATEQASAIRRKNKAPFTCPVENCGSTFTRQFNLKGHLRSHREERPYVCNWPKCGKGFARQHDCKRHQALHLNIRPYPCEGCGKTFARMDALNRHHKTEGGVECRRLDPDLDVADASASHHQNSRRGGLSGGGDFSSYLAGTSGSGGGGGGWGGSGYVA